MLNIVALIALVVMGVIIYVQRGMINDAIESIETRIIPIERRDSLTGNQLEPEHTIPYSPPYEPRPDYSSMKIDQLINAVNGLSNRVDSLSSELLAVNQYEKKFGDSTYSESINFEITRNKLKSFTRNIQFNNKETIKTGTPPDKVHYFGGVFAQGSSERAGLGVMLGIENKKRQLFTVGFDPINKVWVGGVTQRIR